MIFYDHQKNELLDAKIIYELRRAIELYEEGSICECKDLLVDICYAIDEFEGYMILQKIKSNPSCTIAASNGKLTIEGYTDDWLHELHNRMAAEKEIKPL